MEPFVGEIRAFGFAFNPRGWAACNGQLLPISTNTALFSLLGTTYGGNGTTSFGLPDLRGRVAMHQGQGPGLTTVTMGQAGGAEAVALTTDQGPVHSHIVAAAEVADSNRPDGAVPAPVTAGAASGYAANGDGTTMNATMVRTSPGGQPHENRQPFLVINWCIALVGIFPSRE